MLVLGAYIGLHFRIIVIIIAVSQKMAKSINGN